MRRGGSECEHKATGRNEQGRLNMLRAEEAKLEQPDMLRAAEHAEPKSKRGQRKAS